MRTQQRALDTIPVAKVRRWPNNPPIRVAHSRQFREMVDHIRAEGQIDPIDVVPDENGDYVIVRGHRRFHAIADVLGETLIQAWVWFLPFQVALEKLVPTERMQRPLTGLDVGQVVGALGLGLAEPLLQDRDAAELLHARAELPEALFLRICTRYGPRFLARARVLSNDEWSMERVARTMLAHGNYRDLELVPGLGLDGRREILARWEREGVEASGG